MKKEKKTPAKAINGSLQRKEHCYRAPNVRLTIATNGFDISGTIFACRAVKYRLLGTSIASPRGSSWRTLSSCGHRHVTEITCIGESAVGQHNHSPLPPSL